MRHFVYTKPGSEEMALARLDAELDKGTKVRLLCHVAPGLLGITETEGLVHTGWQPNGSPFDLTPYLWCDVLIHVVIRQKPQGAES